MEESKRIVVKRYGRGSLLGVLSPILAFFMASQGMRGWEESSLRAMEKDAVKMAKLGYRVVSSDAYGFPPFGIASYKVTYELIEPESGQ